MAGAQFIRVKPLLVEGKFGLGIKAYAVKGVKLQNFKSRVYPWFEKERLVVEEIDGWYVIDARGADLVLVELSNAGKKFSDVYLLLLRPAEGAAFTLKHERLGGGVVEVNGAELVALAAGGEGKRGLGGPYVFVARDGRLEEVTGQVKEAMLAERMGYSKSSTIKAAHNLLAAWYKLFYEKQRATAKVQPVEQQPPAGEQENGEKQSDVFDSLLEALDKALEAAKQQQSSMQPKQQAEEQQPPAEEQREQQPSQPAAQQSALVDLKRGLIELPDGTILVRFYLVKFQKTSEYAVQQVERNGKGSKEIEEIRRINAEIASLLSSLRRSVNERLARISKVITLEAVFGKSAGMWLALDEEAAEEVRKLHQWALSQLRSDPRYQRLPKQLQKKLEAGYRIHISQWWLPLEEAIQLLQQLYTHIEAAKLEKEQKLQQLKKRKAKKELQRIEELVQKLKEIERRLKELAALSAQKQSTAQPPRI